MESIARLESMGYSIREEGNRVIFNYESGTIKDIKEVEKTIEEIKNNESRIIDFLKERDIRINHAAALKCGYLSYGYNECYGKQLLTNSFLFIQKIDTSKIWTSYRITYNEFLQFVSDKTIIESNNFIDALTRSEKYINNYIKFTRR